MSRTIPLVLSLLAAAAPAWTQGTGSPNAEVRRLQQQIPALIEAGKWAECKGALQEILKLTPDDRGTWYNLACAEARLGEGDEAIASLNTAVEKGWFDFHHMEHDPDLDSVRKTPGFTMLLGKRGEIQRKRAERIRANLEKQMGAGFTVEEDDEDHWVIATDMDRPTLDEVKLDLAGQARALWNDVFTNRLDEYITIVLPSKGGDLGAAYGGGVYVHTTRLLTMRQIGMVLHHEFTHALHDSDQDALGQRHPEWICEGFATLFESRELKDGHAVPLPNLRLNILQKAVEQKKEISWAKFFAMDQMQHTMARMVSYPEGRYIMMYLYEKGVLKKWYAEYTAHFADDASGAKALETVFAKPLAEIETDWRGWVKSLPTPQVGLAPNQPFLGVKVKEVTEGLLVTQTVPEGGAAEAGIKAYDLITHVDGRRVVENDALVRILASKTVGGKLPVGIRRDGKYMTLDVPLKALPPK